MSEPAIQARTLCFSYGDTVVLQDIELSVDAGEVYGLVGADGAGKTTLLKLAAGQLTPARGAVHVLGHASTDPVLRGKIAYMPQGFGLYQDLGVLENLEFFADLHGIAASTAERRIADLLQRTGLKGFEDRRAGHLSGGMMQKLALACALVSEPRAMLLDEPTTGVDPVARRAFWQLLERVRAERVAILYATSNMDEAERCDRVGILEGGRLVRQDTPEGLTRSEDFALVRITGPDVRGYQLAVQGLPGVVLVFAVGGYLNVWLRAAGDMAHFQRSLAGVRAGLEIQVGEPTLHDARLRDLALTAAR